MTDEDAKARRREPGSIEQRPRPGATRCPFCHEPCEADADACACAECLSRHHRACWAEGAACASCGGTRRLELAERAGAATGAATTPAPTDAHGLGEAVDAWLRLGLVYNGALVAITALGLNVHLLRPAILTEVLLGAGIANVCFLLGPAIELAARRLGYRGQALRWALFLPGLALAALLALLACLSVHLAP